jgi:hypothetical protein
MIRRIERGEAQAILAWHPDRLARNSIDGGRVIYLLDTGKLRDLCFGNFSFENSSQGKFMLSILFGYSKYYVDNLSENVKRGNRAKREQGWLPGIAPVGYLNDPIARTIIPDPERFDLVKKLWSLMLTGNYSAKSLWRLATSEWGLTSVKRKRIGGGPLALSSFYHMLGSPFYAGLIVHDAKVYQGKHSPMITLNEFDKVQRILQRPGRPKPKGHAFPLTGLMKCGDCGLAITAEAKTNRRYGYRYFYYHCTHRRRDYRCRQPVVAEAALEEQVASFLQKLRIPEEVYATVRNTAQRFVRPSDSGEMMASLTNALRAVEVEAANLTRMRMRDMVDDETFARERVTLQQRELQLRESKENIANESDWFESLETVVSFSNKAAEIFRTGTPQMKRCVIETVGSKLSLKDKMLSIEAAEPFFVDSPSATFPMRCTQLEDIRKSNTSVNSDYRERVDKMRKLLEEHDTTNKGQPEWAVN